MSTETIFKIESINTKPFQGQKPGTSGLRKKVVEFQQPNYTENFVQCILDGALGANKKGSILIVGGDGRFLTEQAINAIIKISAANGVSKLIIGKDGILSTPAVSHLIRMGDVGKRINGGIILTASHNPGGPKYDFGIKFNCENGGPAPDNITNKIFELTTTISSYQICPELNIDISATTQSTVKIQGQGTFTIDIIDGVKDYVNYMEEIFDFKKIKSFLHGDATGKKFKVLVDSMNGVTGPYVNEILINRLGTDSSSCLRTAPRPDFGGCHPDPNLIYAKSLVEKLEGGEHDIGAAFDGDGDRNMILGKHAFFVTPSDSLAIIAANVESIPYFKRCGVNGYARSMPTAAAVDRVAKAIGRNCYEVPTGWKYFGNLMDAGKISLCGEESFGTGSVHIREKDGLWALLAWLQILAEKNCSVEDIVTQHWKEYGRNVFTRYDYENVEAAGANLMMTYLEPLLPGYVGMTMKSEGYSFQIVCADNYEYKDPIDGSVAKNQGYRICFNDGSRIIYRLSGTGSAGATIRIYIESVINSGDQRLCHSAKELLKPLVLIALDICKIAQFTGRENPTVIT